MLFHLLLHIFHVSSLYIFLVVHEHRQEQFRVNTLLRTIFLLVIYTCAIKEGSWISGAGTAGARRSPSVLSSSVPSHLAYCFWYMWESSDRTWGVIILLCRFLRTTLNINVPRPCRYLGLDVGLSFFLILTFFVLIEKKNLNIMIISYCSPLQSKSFTLHQQMGFLEISRNIKHIRKRNYIFLKRDDNTICIQKLKTQTLSGRSGISASWTGTVI